MTVLRRLAALAPALIGAAAIAQSRPNLVFLLSDDQGLDAIQGEHWPNELACNTPNLASFAEQGRVFTNTRVNPNCSPTRAAILTGRDALQTGVNGVIARYAPDDPRDKLSLQTHERTIGEVLQDMGYYTILVDKWHAGYGEDLGQRPQQQGFDVHYSWLDYLPLDDPDAIGDEHVVRMTQFAIDSVLDRPDPSQPYALFYWSIVPHRRTQDSDGLLWWEVDPALAPLSSAPGPATNVSRFRAVVEALDHEFARLLREINVVDVSNRYQPSSNAVVFFTGDNGTDAMISAYGSDHAKNSAYDGGVHVPCFVFGASVPADGEADPGLVSHVDFYDTIADIAGAPPELRGDAPRRSLSFADRIGWAPENSRPDREYSLLSYGRVLPQRHLVTFTDGEWLLIAAAGGTDLEPMLEDEFYNLEDDPEQIHNLVTEGMSLDELNIYLDMRDRIVDYWPASVSELFQPENFTVSVTHEVDDYRLIVVVDHGQLLPPQYDEFFDLAVDPEATDNLVVSGMTPAQQAAYNSMRSSLVQDLLSGAVGPDIQVVDLMVTDTLVLSSDRYVGDGALTIGHRHPGDSSHEELRAYLKFDIASIDELLPEGFTLDDVASAQLIVAFKSDSDAVDENDTGVIRAYPVTVRWTGRRVNYSRLENGWLPEELGSVDLPPHIIPDPIAEMRGIPLPLGTPVSFGHNDTLLDWVREWYMHPNENYGLTLIADPLTELGGDQSVDFLRTAGIRLTFRRQ